MTRRVDATLARSSRRQLERDCEVQRVVAPRCPGELRRSLELDRTGEGTVPSTRGGRPRGGRVGRLDSPSGRHARWENERADVTDEPVVDLESHDCGHAAVHERDDARL